MTHDESCSHEMGRTGAPGTHGQGDHNRHPGAPIPVKRGQSDARDRARAAMESGESKKDAIKGIRGNR